MSNTSNQAQEAAPKSNVVSFASKRLSQAIQVVANANNSAGTSSSEADQAAICDAMKKNMDNAERLRKERLKANQGVLKSYKIKN